ncbi:MAG: thiamine pyrophosphate-dependent dehydrogenase E1 component subunit alpha [bacterium]
MTIIRRFEERILELFSKGELFGTTHACVGQEAIGVALVESLTLGDIIISNHRCHGHYLARTGDVRGLMAELMGKKEGVCGGRGGSQHLCRENFYTNGVQGNMSPVAVGMAFAEKRKKTGAVTVLFVGDGTFGEGVLYEALNMASLWNVPLLLVVENNRIAQSTLIAKGIAGSFVGRARGFDIEASEIESNDVEELVGVLKKALEHVRDGGRPFVQVINTFRLCGHSKGDDFRDPAEIERGRSRDPLKILSSRMESASVARIDKESNRIVKDAEEFARNGAFAEWSVRKGRTGR